MADTAELFVCLSMLAALFAFVRGLPMLAAGLRDREHADAPLRLARGARWSITAAALVCIAAGLASESEAFFVFGIAFLAEEVYETTAVVWILEWGRKRGFL